MSYVGNFPAAQPLSSADLLNDIVTADKIAAGAVVLDSADVTGVLPVSKGGTGGTDGATSGAIGGGSGSSRDKLFNQTDQVVTNDWTIGQDAMVSGVAVTVASPAVFTLAGHGFSASQPVRFSTTGALPAGLSTGEVYYVIATGLTLNTFQVSLAVGGAAVGTAGTQSGVHSVGRIKDALVTRALNVAAGKSVTVPVGSALVVVGAGAPAGGVDPFANVVKLDGAQTVSGSKTFSSPVTFGAASMPVPSGTAPVYAARAWANFDGTGTVTIRASGNVSSITDNGTGDYTVNFTTALQDANYSSVVSGNNGASLQFSFQAINNSASACRVTSYNASTFADMANIHVAVFR